MDASPACWLARASTFRAPCRLPCYVPRTSPGSPHCTPLSTCGSFPPARIRDTTRASVRACSHARWGHCARARLMVTCALASATESVAVAHVRDRREKIRVLGRTCALERCNVVAHATSSAGDYKRIVCRRPKDRLANNAMQTAGSLSRPQLGWGDSGRQGNSAKALAGVHSSRVMYVRVLVHSARERARAHHAVEVAVVFEMRE
eukprot:3672718-Pleurochrysis_carterae.AAC.1